MWRVNEELIQNSTKFHFRFSVMGHGRPVEKTISYHAISVYRNAEARNEEEIDLTFRKLGLLNEVGRWRS